jgi:hypothetical protein
VLGISDFLPKEEKYMTQKLVSIMAGLVVVLASIINPMTNPVLAQGNVVVVEGDITSDTTWTPDNEYVLSGAVFVKAPATLTILAGTTIKGLDQSFLVIERSAKLMAEGTPTAPIVFTSAQEPGSRTARDWGGVWINGRAPINVPGGEDVGEAGLTGIYGGGAHPDPNDSSGVIRYVRIEFAGFPVAPDRELNNFTLAGVGAETVVDHVHVNRGADDGIEFFGGTVNVKYILITGPGDDGFDWQTGYTGKAQFVVVQQDAEVDPAVDRGIEADNNEQNNLFTPVSNPTIYNATFIGDPRPGLGGGAGIVLRRGTAGTLRNIIVMGFKRAGIDIQGEVSQTLATSGQLSVDNAIFFMNNPNFASGRTSEILSRFPNVMQIDPLLGNPFNLQNPDFRPIGLSVGPDAVATPPNDGFFEPVNFIGGVNPEDDWTKAQWIEINLN